MDSKNSYLCIHNDYLKKNVYSHMFHTYVYEDTELRSIYGAMIYQSLLYCGILTVLLWQYTIFFTKQYYMEFDTWLSVICLFTVICLFMQHYNR